MIYPLLMSRRRTPRKRVSGEAPKDGTPLGHLSDAELLKELAGPTGGTEEKPVGLVFIALADGKHTEVVEKRFPGGREQVRWYATQMALEMLRRKLR